MSALADSIRPYLELLYASELVEPTLGRIGDCVERRAGAGRLRGGEAAGGSGALWDERDVALVTYGDSIRAAGEAPLRTLKRFADARLAEAVSVIHVLPFFPWTSDDGFSVVDYRAVSPDLGDWDDMAALGERFDLMFDLVLNHCSQESVWFQNFLAGREPGAGWFVEADPAADLSEVTRPRSLPLLHAFKTADRRAAHVWTTFSRDQVDLNFANPDVLVEFVDILLEFAERGSRVIRLDAIAFLWKRLGSPCVHLPETHAVVKLMRAVLDHASPRTLLLTETNVPHKENVSYFGDGDEARMVYQFSAAPLILHALLRGDASALTSWSANLEPAPAGCAYFNFAASHDGVGVRPLEGLVAPAELDWLCDEVRRRGGQVSTKRNSDGSDSPYELNITYYSTLGEPGDEDSDAHIRRFLSSQAIMLALPGMPAPYIHSLFGTPNDLAGLAETGRARSINRKKWDAAELEAALADPASPRRRVFDAYSRLLATRRGCPAFHPDSPARTLDAGPEWFAIERGGDGTPNGAGATRALCVTNVTGAPQTWTGESPDDAHDRITGEPIANATFGPWETRWLVGRSGE